jgi:hypothetical protein
MKYYLNELSILSPCSNSREQGKKLMEQFVNVCREAEKIGFDQLKIGNYGWQGKISIKNICLSDEYFVFTWLRDSTVKQDIQDRFRAIATQTPFVDDDEEEILQQHQALIYNYNNKEALGLGLAYLKSTLAVSFMSSDEWNTTNVNLERWHNDKDPDIVTIDRHAAALEHIDIIKRTFEFNPKHGICGKGAFPNESIMHCCTIGEAEKLLNRALSHPKRDRWFCNYDKKNGLFVVFLPHEEQRGKYHGFHYENTPNSDPDRDLNNPQNGIPKFMQDKLKQRMGV